MRQRLQILLPEVGEQIPLFTFHALGLSILQEHWHAAGLQRGFRIAAASERLCLLQQALDVSEPQARALLSAIAHAKRTRTCPEATQHGRAFVAYQQALEARNLVDYDDLIGRAVEVIAADPNLHVAYQRRYPWVFIDEYQDIDEQQVRLLKQLVPAHGNVCAIGDPDQAIYGFRGADVRFFERFADDFPQSHTVRLTRNYRSDRHIVTVSSQVMAAAGSGQGAVPVRQAEPGLITVHAAPTENAEAEFVVQTIEHLLGGHSFFSLDSGRSMGHEADDFSFADFAVLYRTAAQTPALIETFRRSGMPFQKRSHTPLMGHPGVPVLIDTLLKDQATGPLRGRLEAAATHHGQDREAAALPEAFTLLQPLAEACGEDLERFLATLALDVQVDTWDPRADRISLLTLHAAKGLEFPVVFIVGCEEGILPLTWGTASDIELDAERRLFYVGITRVKTRLYLCHAQKRLWRGRVQSLAPSPYLSDMEEGLLERRRTRLQADRGRQPKTQLELF
ncbi:ATP-dependent DNA helicase Rep [Candidatus Entotheonellaceae bacterium PAL068K]